MSQDLDLDLDAVSPSPIRLKLHGKRFELKRPTVRQIIRIQRAYVRAMQITKKMNSGDEVSESEILDALDESMDSITSLSPELKDENLNHSQLRAITELVMGNDEAAPKVVGESNSQESSPTSSENIQHIPQTKPSMSQSSDSTSL